LGVDFEEQVLLGCVLELKSLSEMSSSNGRKSESSFEILEFEEFDQTQLNPNEYVIVSRPCFSDVEEAQNKINELEKKLEEERHKRKIVQTQNRVISNKVLMYSRSCSSLKEDLDKKQTEKDELKKQMLHCEMKVKGKLNDIMKMEEAHYLRDLMKSEQTLL